MGEEEEEEEVGGWFRRVNPSASFLVPKFVGFLVSSEGGGGGGEWGRRKVNVSVLTSSWSCGGSEFVTRSPSRRNLDFRLNYDEEMLDILFDTNIGIGRCVSLF